MATSEAAGIQRKVGAHQAIRFMQLLGGGVFARTLHPLKFNKSPLKNDGWIQMGLLLGLPIF